jgi:hypothetical protein
VAKAEVNRPLFLHSVQMEVSHSYTLVCQSYHRFCPDQHGRAGTAHGTRAKRRSKVVPRLGRLGRGDTLAFSGRLDFGGRPGKLMTLGWVIWRGRGAGRIGASGASPGCRAIWAPAANAELKLPEVLGDCCHEREGRTNVSVSWSEGFRQQVQEDEHVDGS